MKKLFTIPALLTAFLLSASASALNYQGFVNTFVATTSSTAYGTYNVGTNPRPGHENSYIKILSYTVGGPGVRIEAYDAVNNRTVSCWSYSGSGVYSHLNAMAKALGGSISDGTYIYFRADDSGNCDYLYIAKASYYQQ